MKKRIRLTESQLNRVVKESVKKMLREHGYGDPSRNENIEKIRSQIQELAKLALKRLELNDAEIFHNSFRMNGSEWECEFYPSNSEWKYTLNLYPYNISARMGTTINASLRDEYGTNLFDYVCAAQGAPLGYMKGINTIEDINRLLSAIDQICKYDEDDEDY